MQDKKPLYLYIGILIVATLFIVRDIADVVVPGFVIAGFTTLFAAIINKRNMYSFA